MINPEDIALRSRSIARREARNLVTQRRIGIVGLALLLTGGGLALALNKPEPTFPAPTPMTAYYLEEMAKEEAAKREAYKQLAANRVQLRKALNQLAEVEEHKGQIKPKYTQLPKAKPVKSKYCTQIAEPILRVAAKNGISPEKAQFLLAHARLENGTNPNPPGNNIFNIKGAGIRFRTIEYYGGKKVVITDSFKSYKTAEEATEDYLHKLQTKFPEAYATLFQRKSTYKDFVDGLDKGKHGKYATDIFYHTKFKSAYKATVNQYQQERIV